MTNLVIVAVLIVCVNLLIRSFCSPTITTTITEVEVRRCFSDGRLEVVPWEQLEEVKVLTTSEGPWCEDLYYVLKGQGEQGCLVQRPISSSLPSLPEHLAWTHPASVTCSRHAPSDGASPDERPTTWIGTNLPDAALVPSCEASQTDLLQRLQRLPGFDNEALLAAAGSTEWNVLCWRSDWVSQPSEDRKTC